MLINCILNLIGMHVLNQISICMHIFFLYYKHNFLKVKHESSSKKILLIEAETDMFICLMLQINDLVLDIMIFSSNL